MSEMGFVLSFDQMRCYESCSPQVVYVVSMGERVPGGVQVRAFPQTATLPSFSLTTTVPHRPRSPITDASSFSFFSAGLACRFQRLSSQVSRT